MSKPRTDWRALAKQLEGQLAHERKMAEQYKRLASVWRARFTNLMDEITLADAEALDPSTVQAEDESVSDS